jgi:Domain of unknown function (DUF222)
MSEAPRRLPEDVEFMAPGPVLAALLDSVDRRALSGGDRLRLAQARNRLVSHLQAQLLEDLYAVSWEEPPADGPVAPQQASRYPWAETELAFAMRWTRTAAGGRLEQARELIEDLPAVRAALSAGEIDMPKALVISELVGWLPCDDVELRRAVVDKVIDKAAQWTTGELRARLRKLILAIDPTAARKRYTAAIKTRRVQSFDNPDCTGELWGRNLPPQDAAAAWERLTAIGRAAKAAGDSRSLDQLRADAFLDLLVGEGVAVGDPLTHHTGGVPEAAGLPEHLPPPAATTPANAGESDEPSGPVECAADAVAVPEGWDPAWPIRPWEPIGPRDLHPHPDGAPMNCFDDAGRDFDGRQLWPSDWPGRWIDDPAVAAAAGGRTPLGLPATPSNPAAHSSSPSTAASCDQCGRLPGMPTGPLPAPRRGVVELQVPLSTALGLDDLPGEINGYGPVLGEIARQIIAAMPDAQWRFSAYSRLPELAVHGILTTRPIPTLDRDGNRRRPTAEQAAFVRTRDRTCRAPGCRRPARVCDLDHTQPWVMGGRTRTCNLGCLCRAHHLFRHSTGCELTQLSPGVFVWQTPRGFQYLTKQDPPMLQPLRN